MQLNIVLFINTINRLFFLHILLALYNEINKSYGDPKPLFDELGWQASTNLEEIVAKMINN